MLQGKTSNAIVAVSDLERARAFYTDTLGLEPAEDAMEDVLRYRTGDSYLVVYRSSRRVFGSGCSELPRSLGQRYRQLLP